MQLGSVQRAAIATAVTVILVAGVEVVSIFRGSSLLIEIAFFAIPATLAVMLYDTPRARAVAIVLLTMVSLLAVFATIAAFLMLWRD